MKPGWAVRPLGEVARFLNGRAYRRPELLDQGPHKVLRVGNLFTSQKWYYSNLDLPPDKMINSGDLLYAWSASFGPFRWEGGPAIYHYHIWKVIPDEDHICKDFLHYFLEWDKERIQDEHGAGTTMLHVSKKSMEARGALLPPLDEQRRIVAVLDQAFEGLARARASIEANHADAEELQSKVIEDTLLAANDSAGTTSTTFGDLCGIVRGGSPRPIQSFLTDSPDGMPWIKIADASAGGRRIANTEQRITREGIKRSRVVHPGDFLLSNSMSFGRPYICGLTGCIHDGWLALTPDYSLIIQDYLYYLIISNAVQNQFESVASGTTVRNLNIDRVSGVDLKLPPMVEQERAIAVIENAIANAEEVSNTYTAQLADLATLRQSLLTRAFRGELT